jgi:hypothetical protein
MSGKFRSYFAANFSWLASESLLMPRRAVF